MCFSCFDNSKFEGICYKEKRRDFNKISLSYSIQGPEQNQLDLLKIPGKKTLKYRP